MSQWTWSDTKMVLMNVVAVVTLPVVWVWSEVINGKKSLYSAIVESGYLVRYLHSPTFGSLAFEPNYVKTCRLS